jgi:uncharacterized protein DUF6069
VQVTSVGRSGGISLLRLLWVGLLAIMGAAVANVLVGMVAVALLGVSPGFLPLQVGPVVSFTVVGVLGAVAVFALVARFSRRPVRLFRRIAFAVLVISLVPDLLLLSASPFPGTTVVAVATLMVMHVVAWAISVGTLTTLAVRNGEAGL